jgi:uncharacterized 2Fe-2S/4Fe-4S cluster protein (DUF4445 family)
MPVVTFLPSYRKITVSPGTTILDAAQQAGIPMNVVCGGQGKCGKCIVYVKAGEATFDRQKFGRFFTPEELEAGGSLACQSGILGDLQVFLPESSLIQEQKILIEALGLEEGIGHGPADQKRDRDDPVDIDPHQAPHQPGPGQWQSEPHRLRRCRLE